MPISINDIQNAVKENQLLLSNKQLNDEDVTVIFEFLETHPEITTLDVCNNNIGNAGAKLIAKNVSLKIIVAWGNNIGDEGAIALANNLTLIALDLGENGISDKGAETLGHNTTLTALILEGNNISKIGAVIFTKFSNLTTLDIEDNNFDEQLEHDIQLHIKQNQDAADINRRMPMSFFNCYYTSRQNLKGQNNNNAHFKFI